MYELRYDQLELLTETSEALVAGYKSVLLQLATGGGKTVIAGEIARRIAPGTPEGRHAALFLVHRRELIQQAYNTLSQFGLGKMTGVVAHGYPVTPWAKFQIGSIPTMVRRLDQLSWLKPRLLFFDEAHHVRAASWEKVADHYAGVSRIGLTATPARLDGKGLGTHFDHMVVGPSYQELVGVNALASCTTFTVKSRYDRSQLRVRGGDYSKEDLAKLDNLPVIADVLKSFEKHCRDRRTLIFHLSVAASQRAAERFRAMGYRAEHVDGETPPDVRDKIFGRFQRGDTQVLMNVMLATEGYDCPGCDAVMVARPTKSVVLWKQMGGRGMRPKPGGGDMVMVDLFGNVDDLGDPDSDIEWSLDEGVNEDSVEKARLAGRSCENCGYRYKGQTCPLCGTEAPVRTPVEIDMELVESSGSRGKAKSTVGQRRRTRIAVIQSGGDKNKMQRIAEEMGLNPRIIYVWNNLYGKEWDQQKRREDRRRAQGELTYG